VRQDDKRTKSKSYESLKFLDKMKISIYGSSPVGDRPPQPLRR
jgi:hypothetical protein